MNVGKLSSSNVSVGCEWVTAIVTLGIICDASEVVAWSGVVESISADIVGSCVIDDLAEVEGTCCVCVESVCVDSVSSSADVSCVLVESCVDSVVSDVERLFDVEWSASVIKRDSALEVECFGWSVVSGVDVVKFCGASLTLVVSGDGSDVSCGVSGDCVGVTEGGGSPSVCVCYAVVSDCAVVYSVEGEC